MELTSCSLIYLNIFYWCVLWIFGSFTKLARETLSFWVKAFSEDTAKRLENFGFIQFRPGGIIICLSFALEMFFIFIFCIFPMNVTVHYNEKPNCSIHRHIDLHELVFFMTFCLWMVNLDKLWFYHYPRGQFSFWRCSQKAHLSPSLLDMMLPTKCLTDWYCIFSLLTCTRPKIWLQGKCFLAFFSC